MIDAMTGEIEDVVVQPADLLALVVSVLKGEKPQLEALNQEKRFVALWRTAQGYSLGQAVDDLRAGGDPMTILVGILSVIWAQSRAEDDAKFVQAEALRLLHASDVWYGYADWMTVGGKQQPSWRSFVMAYLPCKYVTAVERENVVVTYGQKLGWSPERMKETGMGKMTAARNLVEAEIEAGGLTEETAEVLRSGSHEDVLYCVAQKKGEAIGFSFNGATGELTAWLNELPFVFGRFDRQTPENVTEINWQAVLELAVKRLRATVTN